MISYEVPIDAKRMTVGVQGENQVREFLFDISAWRAVTGEAEGTADMIVQRPGDKSPYAAVITMADEDTVSWVPVSVDTARAGVGKIQLRWYSGGQLVKTRIVDIKIDPALEYQLPDDSLDPWASWMADAINAAAELDIMQRDVTTLKTLVASPFNFKGTVTSQTGLPEDGNTVNDTYYVEDEMRRYSWTGSAWMQSSLDETQYADNLADALEGAIRLTEVDPDGLRISIGSYLNTSNGKIVASSAAEGTKFGACFAYIAVRKGDVIAPATGYRQRVCSYHLENGAYVFDEALTGAGMYLATSLTITADCFIRYGFRREDSGQMTEDEAAGAVTITRRYPAADAVAVEDLIDHTAEVDTKNWFTSTGSLEPESQTSKGFAEAGPIPVTFAGRYTLSAVFTRDEFYQDSSVNRVRIYDRDGALLDTLRYTWTAAVGSTSYYYYDLVLPEGAAWIVINYAKWATDLRLTGPASRDPAAWQKIARLEETVEELDRTAKNLRKNNPQMVRELTAVAESYLSRTDGSGNPVLVYGSPTALDQNYAGDGKIDCSAFVGMVLRGIDFDSSVYATGLPAGASNAEGDDDDTDPEYDPFDNGANPVYQWSINPYEWEVPRNTYTESSKGPVRTAAQLAQWMAERGQEIPIDPYYDNLEPGDVVFYSRLSEKAAALEGEYRQEARYRKINHTAVLTGKIKVPANTYDSNGNRIVWEDGQPVGAVDWDGNTVAYSGSPWDVETYPWLHRFVEVTNVRGACQAGILEISGGDSMKGNNIHTLKMCCRPDLGGMAAPAELAETIPTDEGPGGYLRYDDDYLYLRTASGWKRIRLEAMEG